MDLKEIAVEFQRGQPEHGARALLHWPDSTALPACGGSLPSLAESLAARRPEDPFEDAVVRFVRAQCAYRMGNTDAAVTGFRECAEMARKKDDSAGWWALECLAQWSLALALRQKQELEPAVRAARAAAAEARRRLAFWMEGAARLVVGRILRDMPGESLRARTALEDAHRLMCAAHPSDPVGVAYVRYHQARLALDNGQAPLALSLLREARAEFGRGHHARALLQSRIYQGWAQLQLRGCRVAHACGEEALERLQQMGDAPGVLEARKLLATVALESDDLAGSVRLFEEFAKGAEAAHDTALQSEAWLGIARVRLAEGSLQRMQAALRKAEPLLRRDALTPTELQWQALDLVRRIRQHRAPEIDDDLRRLRVGLQRMDRALLTAECLALCGFELAREGRLREAVPILKEALSEATHHHALAWTDRFLSTISSVDVRQWITSLVTEMQEHANLAEQYESLRICAVAGLHDTKNLAMSAYAALELHLCETEEAPEAVVSARDSAFRAAALARDVEAQVINNQPQILLNLQPMSIREFLESQQESVNLSTLLGQCTVHAQDGLPSAAADANYLTRVFGNLRSNAEKYAPGTNIHLAARMHATGKRRQILVSFADDGPGIHPEDAEILFNAFKNPEEYRDQRANHGSGFGLHYCKLVIEAHGGRIWVDSHPGRGAAFYFTLPVA